MPSLLQVLHFFGLKRLRFPFPGKGSAKWTVVADALGLRIDSQFYVVQENPEYHGAPQIFGHLYQIYSGGDFVLGEASGVVEVCIAAGKFVVAERKTLTEDCMLNERQKLVRIQTLQPDRVQEPVAIVFGGGLNLGDSIPSPLDFVGKKSDAVEVFAVWHVANWLRMQ